MSAIATTGTLPIPAVEHRIPATPAEELDATVAELAGRAAAWAEVGIEARIALLDELLRTTVDAAGPWAARESRAHGIDPAAPAAGEAMANGPLQVARNLSFLRRTLEQLRDDGRVDVDFVDAPGGRVAARVFPVTVADRLLFARFEGDVWLKPGVTADEARREAGRLYREGRSTEPAGVALVLGAGNVSSIGPMDALYQLFAHNRVVVLKMNPVNEYLGPFLVEALHPLVRDGYLRVVYGGAEQGARLAAHPDLAAIHLTGSDKTHDAVVFGTGDDGARRKAEGAPLRPIPITSELGNVTPVIVVPGPWSDRDLAYQGENIASMLTNNAGFNCVASRLIVQHAAWTKRHPLLDAVRGALDRAEQRVPYYPGAVERWRLFSDSHDATECFGRVGDNHVPFTLLPGLDPDDRSHVAFTTEAFAGVMGEVALDAPRSVPAFLEQAVAFCNDTLWGNLAATILVHPRSLDDPAVAEALEHAVEQLRYGTVVVNHWSGAAGYALVTTPWGAYPGNDLTDIQSGTGWVHNTSLLADEHIEKSVVRGPFRLPVKPPWFLSYERLQPLSEHLLRLEADGRLGRHLPQALWALVRG